MFTELENILLDATDPKYKYIYRSKYGILYLNETDRKSNGTIFCVYNNLFKEIKPGENPVCFRKQILDDIEREYLKAVFRPFAKHIRYVIKDIGFLGTHENIYVNAGETDCMIFPDFRFGTMYKGMESRKRYTLKELGITYD